MKSIYLFSGLGVDHRMYKDLVLEGYAVHHIEWIDPLKNESLSDYAFRLLNQIKTPNPILIGLSFGGVMAIEVARLISIEKIILLASVKTVNEIPFYFRWMGKTGIHKIIPVSFVQTPNFLSEWLFDVRPCDKKLFKEILSDMSPKFVRWAVDRMLTWNNTNIPPNLIHIHSNTDKVLPRTFVKNCISIKNGGHFMTLSNAKELSELIQSYLD